MTPRRHAKNVIQGANYARMGLISARFALIQRSKYTTTCVFLSAPEGTQETMILKSANMMSLYLRDLILNMDADSTSIGQVQNAQIVIPTVKPVSLSTTQTASPVVAAIISEFHQNSKGTVSLAIPLLCTMAPLVSA